MMKLPIYIILVLGLLISTNGWSQSLRTQEDKNKSEKKGFDWDNVIFDGGGGMWFGSNVRFVDLYPSVGYMLTEYYMVGVGFRYMYYYEKYDEIAFSNVTGNYYKTGVTKVFDVNIYGPRIFNRYYLTENLFAHAEYEALSFRYVDYPRRWVGSPLVGGGYANSGYAGSWYIMILYNLNEHIFSPYPNPLIRIGASIGF